MAMGTNTAFDLKAGLQVALDHLVSYVYEELAFFKRLLASIDIITILKNANETGNRFMGIRPIMWRPQLRLSF